MTTKDYYLSLNDKQASFTGVSSTTIQYNSLNLNHNNERLSEVIESSKSFTNDSKKEGSYAYEKSVEGISDSNENVVIKKDKEQKGLIKQWKCTKQLLKDSTSYIKHSFEHPRQQKEIDAIDPEVMQFKASQNLLSPYQSNTNSGLPGRDNNKMENKLSIGDATSIFEMEEENGEESKEDSLEKLRQELRKMLYAFGDVKNPHEVTLDLLYSMVVEYITNVAKIGQSLEPRKKLTLQAIHYMTQHDIKKFERIRELLTMHEQLKKAKKEFDTPI